MKKKKNKSSKPQNRTHFQIKEGAHFREIEPASMNWSAKDSCIFYIIAREEVEACDTKRLLHDLRPEVGNPLFASGPGNVIFMVSGYDDDPRDLPQIPEFRAFVRKVQESSPCWLYFAVPLDGWLRIIVAAATTECRVMTMNGKSHVALTKIQVAEFMEPQLQEYFRLQKLSGIEVNGIDSHLHETMQDSFPELLAPSMHN